MAATIVVAVLIFVAYWLPTIAAAARHKQHAGGVVVVNLFLGWSGIGWVIALAMACSGPTDAAKSRTSNRAQLERLSAS